MKYIVGRKVGMVQLYDVNGKAIACTVISCEPNKVLEVKGNSVVVGYGAQDEKKVCKAKAGIFKKVGSDVKQYVRTFSNIEGTHSVGEEIDVTTFKQGEYVDAQAYNKGHGFTGAIKRWNFKIGPLSHGAGFPHRWQGSIAMGRGGSQAQRVAKGKKMHGHMGHEMVTVQNLFVVLTDLANNLLVVSGAVPGPEGSLITIKTSYKMAGKVKELNIITKEIQKELAAEAIELENKAELHEENVAAEAVSEAGIAASNEAKEAAEAIAHHEKLLAKEKEENEGGNQ